MRRFLFLDDDQHRHDGFRLLSIGCDVDHVYTARECIEALRDRPRYDYIWLDHDLELSEGGGEESGTNVAEFIRLHLDREKYPTRGIWIHSWNEHGAERMRALIAETGIPVRCKPYRSPT